MAYRLTRLEFSKLPDGHYYLPVVFFGHSGHPLFVPNCFVDTGATNCAIPRIVCEKELKLPVLGHDNNVGTATGSKGFDYTKVPTISLAELKIGEDSVVATVTDLEATNVKTWITDEEEFVVGMSLVDHFDLMMRRTGRMIIERQMRQVMCPFSRLLRPFSSLVSWVSELPCHR